MKVRANRSVLRCWTCHGRLVCLLPGAPTRWRGRRLALVVARRRPFLRRWWVLDGATGDAARPELPPAA